MLNLLILDKIIKDALIEDIPNGDISTEAIIPLESKSKVDLIAKEDGVLAGLEVFKRVFELLSLNSEFSVKVDLYKKDGDKVYNKEKIGELTGSTRIILSGERVALNFLGRMSGISTYTNKVVSIIKDSKTKILDTRKTTPNLRVLEKYSVKIGGGQNHRFNLSDGILLKDNHVAFAGGVKAAVTKARENSSFVRKVEVEVENLDMVKEALEARADIIMLDNMSLDNIKEALILIKDKALVECSGNITLDNISRYASLGVDFISLGALTHSAPCLDISMKNLVPFS
jgi:nicotinate-nucleotide pyrophosphorylase (carboxylating)